MISTTATGRHHHLSRVAWAGALGLSTVLLAGGSAAADVDDLPLGTIITKTDVGPTGYSVTFRVESDNERVYLLGDPYFTEPALLGGMDNFFAHEARSGDDWKTGDIAHPIFSNAPLELDEVEPGIFELTTAMPAGAYNYGFFHTDETCDVGFSCTPTFDPENPPVFGEVEAATAQSLSQVFIPENELFPTYDADYQGYEYTGEVQHLLYTADGALDTSGVLDDGDRQIGVYLPPGYDENRAEPYQLLVLSHGAGDNETAWFSQGRAANTVEHAISEGVIDDTIVVTTNFYNLDDNADPGATDDLGVNYAAELRENLLPLIDEQWNVSDAREDRAFGGLSMGGGLATSLLHHNTDLFGYYGIWSGAAGAMTEATSDELENANTALGIHIGTGIQDQLAGIGVGSMDRATVYRQLGLPVVETNMDGGHTFQVWREMLHQFLGTVAFKNVDDVTPATTFSDLSIATGDDDYTEYFREISWLAEEGIARGWDNGDGTSQYRPFSGITRDAMATYLYRAASEPAIAEQDSPAFSDVSEESEHYDAIQWLAAEGISEGWDDGTYRPYEQITRDAIAAFLFRYADVQDWSAPEESPFSDVLKGDSEFYDEITWLADAEITTGWADGTFRPFEDTTRDAMAAFLFRLDRV